MPRDLDRKSNAFFSVLRQAGKPASLHITKFDLPEAYGIVNAEYRTKGMAHVQRFRLASASRASKRRGTPQQTLITEEPSVIVTTTSHHQELAGAGVELPSLRSEGDDEAEGGGGGATLEKCGPPPRKETVAPLTEEEKKGVGVGGYSSWFASNNELFHVSQIAPSESLMLTVYGESDPSGMSSVERSHFIVDSSTPLTKHHVTHSHLDMPDNIKELLDNKKSRLPLTITNVSLLCPEPRDETTGSSRLKELHQKWISLWCKKSLKSLLPDDDQRVTTRRSSPSRSPSPATNTNEYKKVCCIRSSTPHVQQHHQSTAVSNQDDDSLAFITTTQQLAMDDNSNNNKLLKGAGAVTLRLRNPLTHLSALDPVSGLLQACHFSSSNFPSKSWLALSANVETEMAQRAKAAHDEAAHQSTVVDSGSLLREHAADPALLLQRMMSVSLSSSELDAIRGNFAICRRADALAFSDHGDSSHSMQQVTSTGSFACSPTLNLSPTRKSFAQAARVVQQMCKDETVASPVTSFADAVRRTVRKYGSNSPTNGERRAQITVSGCRSKLTSFSDPICTTPRSPPPPPAAASTTAAVNNKSKPVAVPIPVDPTAGIFPLPDCVLDGLPTSITNSATKWNGAFQALLDDLINVNHSSLKVIGAHERLVALQQRFLEACSAYVEDNLISQLLDSVQVTVDGILFSLVTLQEKPTPSITQGSPNTLNVVDLGLDDSRGLLSSYFPPDDGHDEHEQHQMDNSEAEYNAFDPDMSRKFCSAQIRALTCFSQHWYKVHSRPTTRCPFANEDTLSILAPSAHVTHNDDYFKQFMKDSGISQKRRGGEERESVFPLSCAVHHLGFVVMCTARLPGDVEAAAAPVSRVPRDSLLVATVGHEIGVAPYVDSQHRRVDTSRHIVCAGGGTDDKRSRTYILTAPSLFPPMIPTMKYHSTLRLRPEFTSHLSEMIPSDAFSTSASFAEKGAAQAIAVKVARKLLHKSITDIVRCWENTSELLTGEDVCEAMHRRGINMSLLGYIGDLLYTKTKSLSCIVNAGTVTRPGSAASTTSPSSEPLSPPTESAAADNAAVGRKLDALGKALKVIKEEIVVRVFRSHWNVVIREACLLSLRDCKLSAMKVHTTDLIKQLLGNESDPLVSTFWSSVINPLVRSHFHFRSPLGRKDLSLRTTLRRLESLCGIVLSPGTAKDALNAAMLTKHEDLLSLDLRNTRAIAIGSVVELRPYVKAPALPYLPSLSKALANDGENKRASNAILAHLDTEIDRVAEEQGPLSDYSQHLRIRKNEVMFSLGDHMYEACEAQLIRSIVQLQNETVPFYYEAAEECLRLSRLFFESHRNIESARCADDAVTVAISIPLSQYEMSTSKLFVALYAAAKECGNRELAIHALERLIVSVVHQLEHVAKDPYRIAATWSQGAGGGTDVLTDVAQSPRAVGDFLSGTTPQTLVQPLLHQASALLDVASSNPASSPKASSVAFCPIRRHVLFLQSVLYNATVDLVESYKAISYYTLDVPLSVHESVASPFFLQFIFELGCVKLGYPSSSGALKGVLPLVQGTDVPAAKSIFARAMHIAEILSLKATTTSSTSLPPQAAVTESQLVGICRANLVMLREL